MVMTMFRRFSRGSRGETPNRELQDLAIVPVVTVGTSVTASQLRTFAKANDVMVRPEAVRDKEMLVRTSAVGVLPVTLVPFEAAAPQIPSQLCEVMTMLGASHVKARVVVHANKAAGRSFKLVPCEGISSVGVDGTVTRTEIRDGGYEHTRRPCADEMLSGAFYDCWVYDLLADGVRSFCQRRMNLY